MFGRIAEAMVQLFPQNLNCDDKLTDSSATVFKSGGLFLPQLAHFIPAAKVSNVHLYVWFVMHLFLIQLNVIFKRSILYCGVRIG